MLLYKSHLKRVVAKTRVSRQLFPNSLSMQTKKHAARDPHQVCITRYLVSFIAEDFISLSVVESSGFRAFVIKWIQGTKLPVENIYL